MDEPTLEDAVVIRPFMQDSDQGFIYSTWRSGSYFGNKREKDYNPEYFSRLTKHIKNVIPIASIRIACLKSDPNTIIGYSVSRGTHLDWIYVKIDYRQNGIGKLLLPKNIETVTSDVTEIGRNILNKKNFKIKENNNADRRTENRQEDQRI